MKAPMVKIFIFTYWDSQGWQKTAQIEAFSPMGAFISFRDRFPYETIGRVSVELSLLAIEAIQAQMSQKKGQ